MTIYHFSIYSAISIENAWEEISRQGIEALYSEEDEAGKNKIIVCRLTCEQNPMIFINKIDCVQSITEAPDLSTDWEGQWAEHGFNYYDGYVHLPVADQELLVKPGPGFGDASHSTTRLVLQMMEKMVQKKTVLDIGCGSGILGLAALMLGASFNYAIDIDEEALLHTKENAELNQLDRLVWIGRADQLSKKKLKGPLIGLMNMISSEQKEAWMSIKRLTQKINEVVTSGILAEEQAAYVELWQKEGWSVLAAQQENEWMAFHMKRSVPIHE